jgi:hypothetical protein
MRNKSDPQKTNHGEADPLNAIAVGLEANFDCQTRLAYKYRSDNVYAPLLKSGLKLQVIAGSDDMKKVIGSAFKISNSNYITGCGHGGSDAYYGYKNDLIFAVKSYDRRNVQDKIIHFLSCRNAQELGPDLVSSGCSAFFGYNNDFVFHVKYADIFFECDAQIDLGFAAGLMAEEVHNKVIATFDKYIQQFRDNNQSYEAAALAYNKRILRSPVLDSNLGCKNARLESPSVWRRALNWIAEGLTLRPKSTM